MDIDWSRHIEDPISGEIIAVPKSENADFSSVNIIIQELLTASQTAPDYDQDGIKRWHLDGGMVVADSATGNPGVYFYPESRDSRILGNPIQVSAFLIVAQEILDSAN